MAQISTIKYTDIKEAKRYDAEYFKPEYLSIERKFQSFKKVVSLRDASLLITNGHTPRHADLSVGNIKFLTAEHVEDFKIETTKTKYIKEEPHNTELKNTIIQKNDIIVTIKGRIGNFAVIDFDTNDLFNINQDVGRIVLKDEYNPYYISGFLNSKYGKLFSKRVSTGQINPFLGIGRLETLKIPLLPQSFQIKMEETIKVSYKKRTQSKQLYKEAEELLLEELGLLDYKPEHTISFETTRKKVTDVVRFDAEYFQPKYEDIIEKIESYKDGFDIISNQFSQNKTLSKKDKEFYNYIEISDVNVSNGKITSNKIRVKDIPANGKRKLFKDDLLISKVRPYRGAISFIDFEKENLLGSGAFTVLQEKTEYKKEVLMIFLKTIFIKELLLRYNCGTSYPVIKDEDILNLKIPLIKSKIQIKIAEKIQESHKLRKESEELLEKAKKMVEDEIEK